MSNPLKIIPGALNQQLHFMYDHLVYKVKLKPNTETTVYSIVMNNHSFINLMTVLV